MLLSPLKLPSIENYLELKLKSFSILGRSIGGVETVFTLPQFNITFDTGRAPHFACSQDFLALTHFHPDHAGGLPFYLGLRCLNDLKPLKIIVPESKKEEAIIFLAELKKIMEAQFSYEIASAKDPITLRENCTLEAVKNFHCTPSTGYLIRENKKKLKKEFIGKTSQEIVEAKNKNIEINENISEIELAFSGDSTGEFLASEANKAKVLLMECTFFGDDADYEKIKYYGHTHIRDWKKYADQIQSETVIMTHTSQRYQRDDIEKECKKNLPQDLIDRLIIFR